MKLSFKINKLLKVTTKLLSAEMKNSQVILRIVLPILTKFLQKSQICRAPLNGEVAKRSAKISNNMYDQPFANQNKIYTI